jgi:hypothetical protein
MYLIRTLLHRDWIGIATGYTHYFGKDNNGYKNNDVGVVPVAALIRIYPNKQVLFWNRLRIRILVGDNKVASNTNVERPTVVFTQTGNRIPQQRLELLCTIPESFCRNQRRFAWSGL